MSNVQQKRSWLEVLVLWAVWLWIFITKARPV